MEKILQQILEQLKELKDGQKELRENQVGLKENQVELRENQIRIENKLDSVHEHTAKITEDITKTNMKLDEVIDDIEFLKYKEHKTEEDLFKLKNNFKLVK